MNKQIVILTRDLTLGGVGTHTQGLVEMFLDAGYCVVLIAPNNIFGNRVEYFKVNVIGKTFITREISFFFLTRSLINKLKLRDNIILGQFNFLNIGLPRNIIFRHFEHFGQLESIKYQQGLIKKVIGYVFHFLYQALDYISINGARKVIYVSEHTLEKARIHYPKHKSKFIHIPNFIKVSDVITLEPKKHTKLILLFVGRLEPLKGIDSLCQLLEAKRTILEKEIGSFELIIIGDGILREKLEKFSFTRCLGKMSHADIIKYYTLSDIFIFPSLYENCPTVILEAMDYGNLILGRDTGDVRNMLGNTSEQIFYNDNEIIEKIVNLNTLGTNERNKLIMKNRENIKNYSQEKIFLEIKNVIHEV